MTDFTPRCFNNAYIWKTFSCRQLCPHGRECTSPTLFTEVKRNWDEYVDMTNKLNKAITDGK